jgi:hypothetical protein
MTQAFGSTGFTDFQKQIQMRLLMTYPRGRLPVCTVRRDFSGGY